MDADSRVWEAWCGYELKVPLFLRAGEYLDILHPLTKFHTQFYPFKDPCQVLPPPPNLRAHPRPSKAPHIHHHPDHHLHGPCTTHAVQNNTGCAKQYKQFHTCAKHNPYSPTGATLCVSPAIPGWWRNTLPTPHSHSVAQWRSVGSQHKYIM